MTIDLLIELLKAMKETSSLGGDTVVVVCIQGLEYQEIRTVSHIPDDDGAVITLGIDAIPLHPMSKHRSIGKLWGPA